MEILKPHIYFSWITSNLDPKLKHNGSDILNCLSSIGPYKNAYGFFPLLPNGIYYWEILIRKGTYFKIGIVSFENEKENIKGAFSDISFGYAYYSQGELRSGSNKKGPLYGEGFGAGDNVGVLFDRNKGTLSFFLNGKDLGIAFSKINKKMIFFPAVACLLKDESFAIKLPPKED